MCLWKNLEPENLFPFVVKRRFRFKPVSSSSSICDFVRFQILILEIRFLFVVKWRFRSKSVSLSSSNGDFTWALEFKPWGLGLRVWALGFKP